MSLLFRMSLLEDEAGTIMYAFLLSDFAPT